MPSNPELVHSSERRHAFVCRALSDSLACASQVRRLESQISQAEAQAHAAEAARAELQQELQHLSQTLEETKTSSEQHTQVGIGCVIDRIVQATVDAVLLFLLRKQLVYMSGSRHHGQPPSEYVSLG